jgi:dihydrolipoamide dehydrogenase
MKEIICKLLVIGGGPGGYVCAIRAGQLGIDTVLVEAGDLGGTCLNVGCIPSKALIHAAEEFDAVTQMAARKNRLGISVISSAIDLKETVSWKAGIVGRLTNGVAGLLARANVKVVRGWGTFRDGKTVDVATEIGQQTIRAESIVIATGSRPLELPGLPFGGPVISSTEALDLIEVPGSLAVVGAGYIGMELGTALAKLGAKVTIVEAEARILPQYDTQLTAPVAKRLGELGIEVLTGARARGLTSRGDVLVVDLENGDDVRLEVDKVLVSVGRKPLTHGWGLEELDLDRDGVFLRIDERCRTSMRGVYAVGDVTGEPMLAHRAMAQGAMTADIIAGQNRAWDRQCIPAICFTDPEVVTAGLSPDEAREQGRDIKVGLFPFQANGRAISRNRDDGFVRVVARADNHLILGIQAVGAGVAELSASFGLALEMGARLEDIAQTIHAHPTQGEAVAEAALVAMGHALHV